MIVQMVSDKPIKKFMFLSELNEITNIVTALNTWKEGCGDKLMRHKDKILLRIDKIDAMDNDGDIPPSYHVLSNAVIIVQGIDSRATVLNTMVNASNFEISKFINTTKALMMGAMELRPCDGHVTLDDFIDELITVQEK